MAAIASTPAGIPQMDFIENVEEWLAKNQKSVESVVQEFQELFSKYKYLEMRMLQNKKVLIDKLPQIKSALEAVKFLKSKKDAGEEVKANFELADAILAKARVKNAEKVCLWLGANVMLEYPIDEAETLLTNNLATAEDSIGKVTTELEFLRDQITTTEVSIRSLPNTY
eukprot:CAMPEP_0113870136 /NCGR_PEP_ID=MMETSP0780_2-20120614/1916_1 /TAXON_ID=652834 /ORGANISM="Palpitomonas bilix" /LENGTH=168 /DNA_ID=CAMNT_0000855375 /DNA_START=52 /DNA_END=558 /DNA_ORIENTATION=+ /assembly_acc=CAM_ASM_000599